MVNPAGWRVGKNTVIVKYGALEHVEGLDAHEVSPWKEIAIFI